CDAVDHAGVVRTPLVDVVAAEQADGGQGAARRSPGAVAVTVHRLPRAGGGEVQERDRLVDDAVIDHQLAELRGLERLNLPADDGGVAVGAGSVAPTAVGSLGLLDVVDRGLSVRLQNRVLRHTERLAQRDRADTLRVHVGAHAPGVRAGRGTAL